MYVSAHQRLCHVLVLTHSHAKCVGSSKENGMCNSCLRFVVGCRRLHSPSPSTLWRSTQTRLRSWSRCASGAGIIKSHRALFSSLALLSTCMHMLYRKAEACLVKSHEVCLLYSNVPVFPVRYRMVHHCRRSTALGGRLALALLSWQRCLTWTPA